MTSIVEKNHHRRERVYSKYKNCIACRERRSVCALDMLFYYYYIYYYHFSNK